MIIEDKIKSIAVVCNLRAAELLQEIRKYICFFFLYLALKMQPGYWVLCQKLYIIADWLFRTRIFFFLSFWKEVWPCNLLRHPFWSTVNNLQIMHFVD